MSDTVREKISKLRHKFVTAWTGGHFWSDEIALERQQDFENDIEALADQIKREAKKEGAKQFKDMLLKEYVGTYLTMRSINRVFGSYLKQQESKPMSDDPEFREMVKRAAKKSNEMQAETVRKSKESSNSLEKGDE